MLMVSEKREIAGWMLEITYEPELGASAAVETVAGKLYFFKALLYFFEYFSPRKLSYEFGYFLI